MNKVGIIGGSGLDNPDILKEAREYTVDTPYGPPSCPLKEGMIDGVRVVLLARHGCEHTIPPTQVNYRANIWALKEAGCTQILATTAVGSLREYIGRGDLVILDQFIDFTRHRSITFHECFDPFVPLHAPMADPFCPQLRRLLIEAAGELCLDFHKTGTVITIEGPRFSTRAESHMFRQWGADVINMSIAPETVLANEAGIPYAAIAMSTDYDCWKTDEEAVTWEAVLRVFAQNAEKVTRLLIEAVRKIAQTPAAVAAPLAPRPEPIAAFPYERLIRNVPDFPKPGIQFKDITTLIKDAQALRAAVKSLARRYADTKVDLVVGIESRGFIFGPGIALELNAGFVPARKPGKLPAKTVRRDYLLEYGADAVEIHADAITPGMTVLIVDDLIATGGTAKATAELVRQCGGAVVGLAVLVDLENLHGEIGVPVTSLIQYEVDEEAELPA
jgi:5'-methylthioadenosine phosphorylase